MEIWILKKKTVLRCFYRSSLCSSIASRLSQNYYTFCVRKNNCSTAGKMILHKKKALLRSLMNERHNVESRDFIIINICPLDDIHWALGSWALESRTMFCYTTDRLELIESEQQNNDLLGSGVRSELYKKKRISISAVSYKLMFMQQFMKIDRTIFINCKFPYTPAAACKEMEFFLAC